MLTISDINERIVAAKETYAAIHKEYKNLYGKMLKRRELEEKERINYNTAPDDIRQRFDAKYPKYPRIDDAQLSAKQSAYITAGYEVSTLERLKASMEQDITHHVADENTEPVASSTPSKAATAA